jgi:hypothetical protein
VIRHGGAEAVTQDGWNWDLYVSNQALLEGLGDEIKAHSHRVLVSDIRFGRWSPDRGLKRGPIYPSADFRRMEQEGAALFAYLLERYEAPIYPFLDVYELWLLDIHLQPLVLLASATEAAEMDLDVPLVWRIGESAKTQFRCDFVVDAAEVLTRQIQQLASARPAAIWVRRERDGQGTLMAAIQVAPERFPACLPAASFPRYFIAEFGYGDNFSRLVRHYLDWQAPCLLMLASLARKERNRLERLACVQAEAVARHHRLYPELVNAAQIQAARVASMLCQTQPSLPEEYGFASMHYIELDQADMV